MIDISKEVIYLLIEKKKRCAFNVLLILIVCWKGG